MKLSELLNVLEPFEFFSEAKTDSEVCEVTLRKIKSYREIISTLSEEYGLKIKEIEDEIASILKDAINGKYVTAFNSLKVLIEDNRDSLYIHDLSSEFQQNINIYKDSNKYLFKGRVLDWNDEIDRKGIFHIPFDKREYISTQRFSINGVPCIYLGQSIHVVWEELNRPKLDELFVSRFEIDESLKVFDIGINYSDLKIWDDDKKPIEGDNNCVLEYKLDEEKIIEKFILTGVFKIACSVKGKDKNRPFKSEYVFPQLLMSAITESKIADGIRYSSVKVNNESYIYANYAFACQQLGDEQYSEFYSGKMKLSLPVNVGLSDLADDASSKGYFSDNLFRNKTYYKVNEEFFTLYEKTKFYELESKICLNKKLEPKLIDMKAVNKCLG